MIELDPREAAVAEAGTLMHREWTVPVLTHFFFQSSVR